MIEETFTDSQYLNVDDLNKIETAIYELTVFLKNLIEIPNFDQKTWTMLDFPYIEEIDRIEQGIENLGKYFYKPDGWIDTRTWTINDSKAIFDYEDINRWINNLNLIYEHKNDEVTIWNGPSYISWNEATEIEWEE